MLPPALELRKEDAELAQRLDRITSESEVREELEGFNARVRRARMQLLGGPPVITPERDVDAEVEAWHGRRTARIEAQRAALGRPGSRSRAPAPAARSADGAEPSDAGVGYPSYPGVTGFR